MPDDLHSQGPYRYMLNIRPLSLRRRTPFRPTACLGQFIGMRFHLYG
ncbi:hypothetical protein KNP414_07736 [Paenibacillus mucilaginosus KNP414]|uniref:Uncharacterized protein n=1 Tax=Paenibacillus mucilaginosus (strain KNP414) TaxID=1036673 RepID=F8FEY7_PAEMK|nr:hypothetical protein KNP414_07736 [Paenibacillus mucilaginosus KNP414]